MALPCFFCVRKRGVAGQMKKERYQTQSEVTFDFGYSPINILNELAASEWDAQPFQCIVEQFFMVLFLMVVYFQR